MRKRNESSKPSTKHRPGGYSPTSETNLAWRWEKATTPVRTKWDDPDYTGE